MGFELWTKQHIVLSLELLDCTNDSLVGWLLYLYYHL